VQNGPTRIGARLKDKEPANKRDNELDQTLQTTQNDLAAKTDIVMELMGQRHNDLSLS
jgi:hypothetical protein